jgi:actin related protein 2/3 complex subunit 2
MASAPKGLIFLDSKSAILYENLKDRIIEGKREPCELCFSEFDDVNFKISISPECPNIVKVNMGMKSIEELKKQGSKEVIDRIFPNQEASPDEGYDMAIEFDCDNLSNPDEFLEYISNLKMYVMSGPVDRALTALASKSSSTAAPVVINYRKDESFFVCPAASKVTVIFLIDFDDVTDKALARVFLQEFAESQRSVRTAPPVSYSKEPPLEISNISFPYNTDCAGFLSFALEESHVSGEKKVGVVKLMSSFRNYLHYHIKSSKTYLHMRMRKKVVTWLKVLNRAIPETEKEKKTAAGKTFTRK